MYEWDYYVSTLFESAGVLQKSKGAVVCTLLHGKNTKTKLTKNIVTIPEELSSYCKSLLKSFSYDEKPLQLDDPERLKIDVIKEIYSFLPKYYLKK